MPAAALCAGFGPSLGLITAHASPPCGLRVAKLVGTRYLVSNIGIRARVEHVQPHRFRRDASRRLVETTV